MNKIIIANWKANPATLAEAKELFAAESRDAKKYPGVQTIICPPAIYIEELSEIDSGVLGAQDLSFEPAGPYTGEVPVDMLKNLGVTHVLVGHSDRRYKIGESDEVINKKVKAALTADTVPVLLVGERNRTDNRKHILEQQLTADLAGLSPEEIAKILITYEPVWAISTQSGAEADTPENALAALETIKEFLMWNFQFPRPRLGSAEGGPVSNFRFLYGGSVNEKNVADFLKHPEISGVVVGGASLRKEEFAKILKIVDNLK